MFDVSDIKYTLLINYLFYKNFTNFKLKNPFVFVFLYSTDFCIGLIRVIFIFLNYNN